MKRDVFIVAVTLAASLGIQTAIEQAGVSVASAVVKTIPDSYSGRAGTALKAQLDPFADKAFNHYGNQPTGYTLSRSDLGTKLNSICVKGCWSKESGAEVLDWRYDMNGVVLEATLYEP